MNVDQITKSRGKFLKQLAVNKLESLKGEKVFISTSGGRTSMYQCERLLSEGFHLVNDVVILFANTGWEHPKTLEFVDKCFKRWEKIYGVTGVWLEAVVHHGERKSCTHKVVTFETASRKREPFEEAIKKYGLPNNGYSWCTRELKENPIKSYITEVKGWKLGDYYTVLGMRSDEIKRVVGEAVINFGKKYKLQVEDLLKVRELVNYYKMQDSVHSLILSKIRKKEIKLCSPYESASTEIGYSRVVTNTHLNELTIPSINIKQATTIVITRFVSRYLKGNGLSKVGHEDIISLVNRLLSLDDKQNKVYPLNDWFEDKPDKLDILDWWEDQEFDLGLEEWEGNCTGCYKKSTKKLLKVIRDNYELFVNTMEIDYGHIGPNKINGKLVDEPRTMYRQNNTCQTMIALFKQTPTSYLRDHSDDESEGSGCSSSCEAFGGDS